MTTEERLKTLLSDNLGKDKDEIVHGSAIMADLGADSLDVLEICMEIEEEFGIELCDEEFETAKTFGALLSLVESKV